MDADERFKVWPTDRDQEAFRAAMDDDAEVPVPLRSSSIVQAHDFFRAAIEGWAVDPSDQDGTRRRLHAVTLALRDFLKIVVIDLEVGDNAQVIFETLNHRGQPLLAADLVKNLVFQSAQAQGLDVRGLYEKYWAPLDTDFWRTSVAQGRLYRPRIDIFLNYWLTMKLLREVATDRIFTEFRAYLSLPTTPLLPEVLAELSRDAGIFSDLENVDPASVVGIFQYRVIRALDSGAVTPFLLQALSRSTTGLSDEQRDKALKCVESWLVRRTVCRLTAKNVNLLVIELMKAVDAGAVDETGDVTEAFLLRQAAESRLWPTDEHVMASLQSVPLYKSLTRPRVRMLLEALEDDLRTSSGKTEAMRCERGLTVEHVMPQSWSSYWPLPNPDDPLAAGQRDAAVQTLGNLTLVTKSLNPSMSNAPWTDDEAQAHDIRQGKKSALLASVLQLNGSLVPHESWSEGTIAARGAALAERATRIWPRPDTGSAVDPPSVDAAAVESGDDGADVTPTMAEAPSHSGKYVDLYRWLRGVSEDEKRTTFTEIESVLGFALPDSCRTHMAHWYGYDGSAVARAIADAGWKASSVNLTAESLRLTRR